MDNNGGVQRPTQNTISVKQHFTSFFHRSQRAWTPAQHLNYFSQHESPKHFTQILHIQQLLIHGELPHIQQFHYRTSYLRIRDVRPRGLASASRPKNLASASASASWVVASALASASWVVASASWVLAPSLEASRGLQLKRNGVWLEVKSITNSQKSLMPLRIAS